MLSVIVISIVLMVRREIPFFGADLAKIAIFSPGEDVIEYSRDSTFKRDSKVFMITCLDFVSFVLMVA